MEVNIAISQSKPKESIFTKNEQSNAYRWLFVAEKIYFAPLPAGFGTTWICQPVKMSNKEMAHLITCQESVVERFCLFFLTVCTNKILLKPILTCLVNLDRSPPINRISQPFCTKQNTLTGFSFSH